MGKWIHRLLVDTETGIGSCAECGPIQAVRKDGRWKCPVSRRAERGGRVSKNDYAKRRRVRYLTDALACEICGVDLTPATAKVDHDHSVCQHPAKAYGYCDQCVRGVLCGPCNTGLGHFGDDPARLRQAALYLEQKASRPAV